MTKKKLMATLAAVLSLSLCGGIFTGCGSRETTAAPSGLGTETQQEKQGGVISIKVNPEIAVHYDDQGMVTGIEARNDDGEKIIADYTGFEGKECRVVIGDLVAAINKAGYFVEETDGKTNQITLEIEEGSVLPEENFLNMIVAEIQKYTSAEKISTPVTVDGESTYGWSSYGDTDYGPDNDGVTDYDDTDYGTTGDGVTDYDDAKPAGTSGTGNNSTSNKNSSTDYGNTNYGNTNYGNTNYGNTDYGTNSDGVTDYDDGDSNGRLQRNRVAEEAPADHGREDDGRKLKRACEEHVPRTPGPSEAELCERSGKTQSEKGRDVVHSDGMEPIDDQLAAESPERAKKREIEDDAPFGLVHAGELLYLHVGERSEEPRRQADQAGQGVPFSEFRTKDERQANEA